jgi:hypothetical protein
MFLIVTMVDDYTFAPSSEKGVIILEMEALAKRLGGETGLQPSSKSSASILQACF